MMAVTSEPMSSTAGTADPTYLYVAGRGHSGTTLLGVLLGNHPDVAAVGELMYMPLQCFRDRRTRWVGLCACGERPFDCELWGPIIADIEARHGKNLRRKPFSWRISDAGAEEEYRHRAPFRSPLSWFRNRSWRALRKARYTGGGLAQRLAGLYTPQVGWMRHRSELVRSVAARSGSAVIADISKDYLDMRDVYDHASLNTKVVFITRDCRANVWSQVRLYCEQHGETARADARDLIVRSARDWVQVNQRIVRALEGVARQDWIHVRYEDMCRDTSAAMSRVLQLAGLDYVDQVLDFEQPVEHTIAGNRVRFGGRMKEIREDLAWQEELRPDELQVITDICGPLASRLGYAF
jgi:hypothetical protein